MKFFYGPEADMFTFFKIPKLLFSPPYKHISTDAKLLYGLMLDRMSLSAKSERWMDPDGRVFIYFPIAEVMELLDISDKPATKLYKELESVDLIQRKRQGLGKPTKIYVSKFFKNTPDADTTTATDETTTADRKQNRKKAVSRIVNSTANFRMLPFKETETSLYTDNQSDLSISEGSETPSSNQESIIEGVTALESQIRIQIGYEILLANRPWDDRHINGIVSLIADTCSTRKPSIRIGGELRKTEEVKRRLLSLEYEDIEAVLKSIYNPDSLTTTNRKIKNMKAYLLTALYNAPGTSEAVNLNDELFGERP